MTKRTLLIDGDIIAYQVASSIETPIHWGDDMWTLHSDANEGIEKVQNQLDVLQDEL